MPGRTQMPALQIRNEEHDTYRYTTRSYFKFAIQELKMYADYFEQDIKIEPLRKQVKVGLPAEAAFKLFTEGMGRWWPLATHSVGEDQAETCFFEGWTGGRIMEVLKDGSQSERGRV